MRDQHDGAIAAVVAKAVVDVLELVHIDHQQRVYPAISVARSMLALPYLVEHAQIEQAGQRVGLRQVLNVSRASVMSADKVVVRYATSRKGANSPVARLA